MEIGISTGCLYPQLTEDSLCTLLNLGFDSFEIFFSSYSELEIIYLDKMISKLNFYNAKVKSIHPFTSVYESFLLFSAYERRFIDGVRFYENYFRAAAKLKAKYVILHGMHKDFQKVINIEEYCRRFSILSKCANEYGVEILLENVFLHQSGNIDFIKNMKKLIPMEANFTCDTKQAFRCNYSPETVAGVMGKNLKHIHISDYNTDRNCVLPGKGCMDYKSFFETLFKIDYDGDIIIEVYNNCFKKNQDLIEARKFLQHFAKNNIKI